MFNIRKALVMAGALVLTVALTLTISQPTVSAPAPFGEDSRARALGELTPGAGGTQSAPGGRPSRDGAVKIAILDTGIDLDHPGLPVAGDVTFVDGTTSGDDSHGHGTMVAGVVAELIRDGYGGEGAPGIELYAVKITDEYRLDSWATVIDGIDWAWQNGMHVINMSFGGPDEPPEAVHRALQRAHRRGVVLVAGAGNAGNLGLEDSIYYPAHYDEVIAVGATDGSGARAGTSSTGPSLELVAPGVGVETTTIGGYGTGWGTSVSSPFVAGTAAILIASGITDTDLVRLRLREMARDLGPTGRDDEHGYGLVDASVLASP